MSFFQVTFTMQVEIPEWYASQFALVQEPKATIDREVPSNLIVSGGNERVISENEDTHRFLQLLEEILRKQNDDIEENAELRAARGLFQNEASFHESQIHSISCILAPQKAHSVLAKT